MGIDRSLYPGVPEDFPIEEVNGTVAGAQPKLLMVEENGKYYSTGTSPSEVQEAFEICLELKLQLIDYCTKESHQGHTPHALLAQIHQYLLQKAWCIRPQSLWICSQIARELEWDLPLELQAAVSN